MRLARPRDVNGILTIYAPIVRRSATSFELEPPTPRDMEERIRTTLGVAPWLISESGGQVAGYAYAQGHRSREAYGWTVETSVLVHPDFRRRGIGRSLIATLLELLALQGFWRCLAGITLPNDASVSLHETTGFRPLGVFRRVGYKLGNWHDVGWWQTDLRSDTTRPTSPTFLAELQSDGLDMYGMPTADLVEWLRKKRVCG